jgi:hypothetical protein
MPKAVAEEARREAPGELGQTIEIIAADRRLHMR